ncbi:MAG TPA: hypothetical protein VGC04_08270 [Cellulomonas sp.]
MLAVLCSAHDADALWFAIRARRAGAAVTVVTDTRLAFARRRSHAVDEEGTRSVVELDDGTVLDDRTVTGVLNRLTAAPDAAWRAVRDPAERGYAAAELGAFTLSWLAGLRCPVRNRPDPSFLAGRPHEPLVALAAARTAGWPSPDVDLDTAAGDEVGDAVLAGAARQAGPGARAVTAVLLDGAITGPAGLPDDLAPHAGAFAAALGATDQLLGATFVTGPGGWWFAGAQPLPPLRPGGDLLVAGLLAALGADDRAVVGGPALDVVGPADHREEVPA